MTKTATFIRDLPRSEWNGTAKLYRVDPPAEYGWGDRTSTTEYVIASATNAMFSGPETYLFPGDEAGQVLDWGELEGSYRGALDHERAITGAGYTIAQTVA